MQGTLQWQPSQNFPLCDGVCGNPSHYSCIGFKATILKAFKERKNLFWQCDKCIHTPLKVIMAALAERRAELAAIKRYMKFTTDLNTSLLNPLNAAQDSINPSFATLVTSIAAQSISTKFLTPSSAVNQSPSSAHFLPASVPPVFSAEPTRVSSARDHHLSIATASTSTSSAASYTNGLSSSSVVDQVLPPILQTGCGPSPDVSVTASSPTIVLPTTENNALHNLVVISSPKSLFLTRLSIKTFTEDVINYITSKLPGPSAYLHCKKFTSHRNPHRLIASFKIDVPPQVATHLNNDFWPPGALIKEFVPGRRFNTHPTAVTLRQPPQIIAKFSGFSINSKNLQEKLLYTTRM